MVKVAWIIFGRTLPILLEPETENNAYRNLGDCEKVPKPSKNGLISWWVECESQN